MSHSEGPDDGVRGTASPPPARPPAGATKRIDAFESVFQIAQLTVKRSFKGARAWICLALVLLPTAVSALVRGHATPPRNQVEYFYGMLGVYHFGVAVPLTALLFATGFPWPEADEGTLTYWFTTPVRRWTVLAGRLAAALVVGAALLCVDVYAIGLPLSTPPDAELQSVMASACASTLLALPAYLALFQIVSTGTRLCLVFGIVYVLVENFVSVIPGAFARVTLVYYVRAHLSRSIPKASDYAAGVFRHSDFLRAADEPPSITTVLLVFCGVTVVALGLSLLLVETIEYRGRSSQQQ